MLTARILSNTDLADICTKIVQDSHSYSLQIYPLLATLQITGLRVNEVYELDRWHLNDNGTATVTLEKASGSRQIDLALLPAEFHDILVSYPTSNFHFRTRQLNYFIRAHTGWARLSVGGKEVQSHLFRYNYCRQLFDAGWSISAIREQIVHSSLNVTSGYIFNDILASPIRD